MLTFAELAEKNGLKMPVVSANAGFIARYKVRKEQEKFQEAEVECKKLLDKMSYRTREWEFFQKSLEQGWGETFSHQEEELDLQFSTIEEALQAIKQESRRLSKPENSPRKIAEQKEKSLRKKWIEEVVQAAPNNCSLIVVKDKRFHPYNKKEEEAFEQTVEQRQEAYCYALLVMCVWAAFDPRKEPDITKWVMRKNEATVQYII